MLATACITVSFCESSCFPLFPLPTLCVLWPPEAHHAMRAEAHAVRAVVYVVRAVAYAVRAAPIGGGCD